MIVVSDSSPLIALARIGRLDLPRLLYERILVPTEVHHEVTVAGRDLPGGREVRIVSWIEVVERRSPGDQALEQACEGLGGGERGSILLAKALKQTHKAIRQSGQYWPHAFLFDQDRQVDVFVFEPEIISQNQFHSSEL